MIFILRSAFLLMLFTCVEFNNGSMVRAKTVSVAPQSSDLPTSKLHHQGKQHFAERKYELAIATYLELLKIEPKNSEAYNIIGMSLGGLQKYPAAIAAFQRAIALDNNFANAYYNRGYIYQQLGKHSLALTDFERTLILTKGSHFSALINRSSVYALQRNYQLALVDLQRAIELNPESATAYYNRALIKLTIGNKTAYLNDLTIAEKLYRQIGDAAGVAQIEYVRKLY